MARKRYNEEDILRLLREIEVHLRGGMDVLSACCTAGISDKTYYGWRKMNCIISCTGGRAPPVQNTQRPCEGSR